MCAVGLCALLVAKLANHADYGVWARRHACARAAPRVRQVLGLRVAGLGVGLPAAIVASRYIESFLWGVAPHDPVILAGAALAVLAAVAAAGYAPASRASKIDPMVALRSE